MISIPSQIVILLISLSLYHDITSAIKLDDISCSFSFNRCAWQLDDNNGSSITKLPRQLFSITADGPETQPKWSAKNVNAIVTQPLSQVTLTSLAINAEITDREDKCLLFDYYLFGPDASVELLMISDANSSELLIWSRSIDAINKDSWSSFKMGVPNHGGYKLMIRMSTKEHSYAALANFKVSPMGACAQSMTYCDFDAVWPGTPFGFNCNWLKFENDISLAWITVDGAADSSVPIDHSSKARSGRMLTTTQSGSKGRATSKISFQRSGSGTYCFSFWYYKQYSYSDEIFMYQTNLSTMFSTHLWSDKNQGKRDPIKTWNHVRMTLKPDADPREGFEAGIGVSKKLQDITTRLFIDTITLSPGECAPELSCEFSTDACAYETINGKYRWSLGRGRVADPSKLGANFTLPNSDHDFLYIDNTYEVDANATNLMMITSEVASSLRQGCFSFDFFKHGVAPEGTKSVVQLVISGTKGDFKSTNIIREPELGRWSRISFPLNEPSAFTISIVVDAKNLNGTFVAFKDLKVEEVACQPAGDAGSNDDAGAKDRKPGMYDCNFDEHPFFEINGSKGRFCNWESVPDLNNSFRIGTSSSFLQNYSLPRHDHTTGSKRGQFLIASINVYGETVPLTLNLDDETRNGNQLCLSFFTFFKPAGHPMYVAVNQYAGGATKSSLFTVTPSSRWTLFKMDITQRSGVENKIELIVKRSAGTVDVMALDDIAITSGSCAMMNHKHILDCDFESRTLDECDAKVVMPSGWGIKKGYDDVSLGGGLMGSYANYKFESCPAETSTFSSIILDTKEASCVKFWYRINRNVEMKTSIMKPNTDETFEKYSDLSEVASTRWVWLPVMFDNDVFNDWALSISASCSDQVIRKFGEPQLAIDDILITRGKCDLDNAFYACDFESDSCLWTSLRPGSGFESSDFLYTTAIWERRPALEYRIDADSGEIIFPPIDATGDQDGSYLLLQNALLEESKLKRRALLMSPLFTWSDTSTVSADETLDGIACLSFWTFTNHDHELMVLKLSNSSTLMTPNASLHSMPNSWHQYYATIRRDANESEHFHLAFNGTLRYSSDFIAIDNINLRMGEACPRMLSEFTCHKSGNFTIDGAGVCDFKLDCPSGEDEANCGYSCEFETRRSRDYCGWKDMSDAKDSWDTLDGAIKTEFARNVKSVGLVSPQFKGSISKCNLKVIYGIMHRFAPSIPDLDFQIFLSIERQEKFMIFSSKTLDGYVFPIDAMINIGKIDAPFEIVFNAQLDKSFHNLAISNYAFDNCMKYNNSNDSVCSDSEFKCNNGKCIPRTDTCNLNDDCEDASDEIGCFDGDDDNLACTFDIDACDFKLTNMRRMRAAASHLIFAPTRDHTTNSPKGSVLYLSPNGTRKGMLEISAKSECITLFYQAKEPARTTLYVNRKEYTLEGALSNWNKLFLNGLKTGEVLNVTATVPSGAWLAIDDFSFGKHCPKATSSS